MSGVARAVPAMEAREAAAGAEAGLPPEAVADLRGIEASLSRLDAQHATRIGAAARHLLDAGGKRLRPLLTCAVVRALGRETGRWLDLVAAVELVHAGSLLHDDVIDGAGLRRGRSTVHAAFDVHTAILAGDFLFSWAFERLARDGSRELQVAMGHAIRDLCEGEVLERERLFDPAVDAAHARRINRLKTAGLFAYAAEAGALLAGAEGAVREATRAYGLALGEAFQTIDDLLDWEGDPEALGKPPGQDLAVGLVTVPAALGAERDPTVRDALRAFWKTGVDGSQGAERLGALRARMMEVGAFDAARALAQADARRAVEALGALPPGPWRDRLAQAAQKAVERDK